MTIEEGAIFLEEADWKVQNQQVGEEMEVAENLVGEEKLQVRVAAQEGPGRVNLDGPIVDSLEAIQWELEAVSARPAGAQVWAHAQVAPSPLELPLPEYSWFLSHPPS